MEEFIHVVFRFIGARKNGDKEIVLNLITLSTREIKDYEINCPNRISNMIDGLNQSTLNCKSKLCGV